MEHLDGLNKPQKEAVLTTNGPLLIVAGAGAGKTRTLTHRIIHLVKEGVEPHKILAITFTNKAAKEMSARIKNLLGKERGMEDSYGAKELPFMSTFHALGVYMLRNHGGEVGVGKHFSILDKNDSLALIKDSIKTLNIDPKQFEPGRIQSVISKQKGDFITLDEYAASVGNDFFPEIVSKIWTQYEKLLEKNKSLDFDDLLLKTVILLKKSDAVRTYYQNRWQYIHIDEYQDTNAVQYELSRMLAERHGNICVVGDADQNIYSWRGADIKNMLNFEKDYSGAKVVLLEENY
ncbi:MAG TPA: ATP-dependent DNA helicase PcrA, partial [Candidatus Yonathbacteria bacterium]|nr:ATP-dependent DNA helicase PcrA [Candidatus Yonathbacteria bacterium]